MEIDVNDIILLKKKQKNRCAYTGKKLKWVYDTPYKASIDRIDSSKGYTVDNIQLVAKIVNQAKNDLDEKDFLDMIKFIYEERIAKS